MGRWRWVCECGSPNLAGWSHCTKCGRPPRQVPLELSSVHDMSPFKSRICLIFFELFDMFCIFICDITSYIIWLHRSFIYIYIHIRTVYDMFWLLYMLMVLYILILFYIIVFNIFHFFNCYYIYISLYIYIYLSLSRFTSFYIIDYMFGSSLFSAFYGPRSRFLISAFRNASQKRSSQRASGHTSGSGGKTSCSRWSIGRVREAAPVCLAGLKRWAQNQYLAVPLFDWEVVADKPRNHFHASPFPSSLQEDEDSSFHAKTAMLSGLGLCNGAVHSSVPFRPACMSYVQMLQPIETREADPADVAMLHQAEARICKAQFLWAKKISSDSGASREGRRKYRLCWAATVWRTFIWGPFDSLVSQVGVSRIPQG